MNGKCRTFVSGFSPDKIMQVPLQHAQPGNTYKVVSIEGQSESTQRIRELGMMVGVHCTVIRKSPFGGPLEIALQRRNLGLRLTGLRILVEPVEVAAST